MKKNRQEAIIELIQQYPIETQEELLSRLNQIGFKTTQATISRDIRELALIKKPDADGKQDRNAGTERFEGAQCDTAETV